MLTAEVPTKENVARQHQAPLGTPSKKKTAAAAAADAARGGNYQHAPLADEVAGKTAPEGVDDGSKGGLDLCYGVLTVISRKTRRCGSRFPISAPVVTIGSDYQCDVRIQNEAVDALQTKIHVDSKGNLWVTNLSKRFSTRLNGDVVKEPRVVKRNPTMPDIITVADRSFYISYPEANDAMPKAPPAETPLKKVRAVAATPSKPTPDANAEVETLDAVVDNFSSMLPSRTPVGRRSAAPSRLAATTRTTPETPAAAAAQPESMAPQQQQQQQLPVADNLMDIEIPEQQTVPVPMPVQDAASAMATAVVSTEMAAKEDAAAEGPAKCDAAIPAASLAAGFEESLRAEYRQVEIDDDPEKRTSVPIHRKQGRRLSVISFKQRVASDGEAESATDDATSEVALQRRMATPMRHSIATAAASRIRPAAPRMQTPMRSAVAARAAKLPAIRPEKRLESPVRDEIARRADARPNLKPTLAMGAEMKGEIVKAVSKRPPAAGTHRLETPMRKEIVHRANTRPVVTPTEVMDAAIQTEIREKAKSFLPKKQRMTTPIRRSIVDGAARMADTVQNSQWKRLRSNEIAAAVRERMATRASSVAAAPASVAAIETETTIEPALPAEESLVAMDKQIDDMNIDMEMDEDNESEAESKLTPAGAAPRRFVGSRTPGPVSRTRTLSQKRAVRSRSLTSNKIESIVSQAKVPQEPTAAVAPEAASPNPTAAAAAVENVKASPASPRRRLATPVRQQIVATAEGRQTRRAVRNMGSPARRAISSLAAEVRKSLSPSAIEASSPRTLRAASPTQPRALAIAEEIVAETATVVATEGPATVMSPQRAASPVRASPTKARTPTKPSRKSLRFAVPASPVVSAASPAAQRPQRARKSVAPSMVRTAEVETAASLRNKRKSMAPALAAKSMPSSKRTRKSNAAAAVQPEQPAQSEADEVHDELDSLRVVDLRERLQQRGMLTTGTKSVLLARLRDAEAEAEVEADVEAEAEHASVSAADSNVAPQGDSDALEAMKVADLRQLLRERGQPTTGKKAELVERLLRSSAAEEPSATEESVEEAAAAEEEQAAAPTATELHRLKVAELKALAESMGLASAGTKAILAERILQAHAEAQPSLDAVEQQQQLESGDDDGEFDYGRMKVAELRAELARLNQDTAGTKAVLVQRLQAVRAAAAPEDWSKMKVSELRAELERRKMDASGTKAALVLRLQQL